MCGEFFAIMTNCINLLFVNDDNKIFENFKFFVRIFSLEVLCCCEPTLLPTAADN